MRVTLVNGGVSTLLPLLIFLLMYIPTSSLAANLTWVAAADANFEGQETAGFWNEKKFYIGRVLFNGGVHIGHYSLKHHELHFPYRGREKTKVRGEVQVLTYHKGVVTWVRKETGDGRLPYNIVLGGIHAETKEHLYVCRAKHDVGIFPGQMSVEDDMCSITFEEEEHKKEKYELLAISFYGMLRKATV